MEIYHIQNYRKQVQTQLQKYIKKKSLMGWI